jgi:acetoin utilization protein AcuB
MKIVRTAAEIMTKKLVTIRWNEGVTQAFSLMEKHRIRHLPVVGDEGLVVGILSENDLSRALNPSRPGFEEEATVAEFMSWPAITVCEKDSLRDIAEGMIREKVSAVLVTENDNEVVGIMTSEDLLRVLVDTLPEPGQTGFSFRNLPYTPIVYEALREMSSAGI